MVAKTNKTVLFKVALLGATVCADAPKNVSSQRHKAGTRRGRVAEVILGLVAGMPIDG